MYVHVMYMYVNLCMSVTPDRNMKTKMYHEKKIKATVLKSTGQLPRMREKLHELKLVAVYDATCKFSRRVGYRDKCMMRTIHTLPG